MSNNEIKDVYVYDIETLASCFTYTALNIRTEEIKQFVIHTSNDQSEELFDHLMYEVKGLIGYNNVSFDYPIIHHFLINYNKWIRDETIISHNLASYLINQFYEKAQEVIEGQNAKYRDWTKILREKDFLIPQLDLFKIWHYDNLARSTSLKALEISMNFHNVQDMPIEHDNQFILYNQIEEILDYNLNDVLATYEFYKKTIKYNKTELRKIIKQKYNLPCTNWNNGKIGENLILKLYCDKTGKNPWEVRKMRSEYTEIALIDCIPHNIKFQAKEFNILLDFYKNKVITDTLNLKGAVDYPLYFKGIKYKYGLGGLHAAIKSGVYKSNDEYIIKTADVALI